MLSENVNQRILNSVGKANYNEYMLLTKGIEISSILDSHSSVFQMYKYRDKLLEKQVLDDITITVDNLKQSLEQIFLDYLTNSEFKIVKNMMVNHIGGWTIDRLIEIHKEHRSYRIFRLLTTDYNNWLN